ncbi:MAG: EAL domain-containing protein [Mycolicibacterium sp.]|nr:EAL domain-containing protein [Mycolicibacterium sp.]
MTCVGRSSTQFAHDIGIGASDDTVAAVRGVGLAPVLQPIVVLPTGDVIGFEALARWPSLNIPCPTDVFAFASEAGQLDDLDRLCVDAAIDTALARRLPRGTLLAVNCEPASPYCGPAGNDLLARGRDELTLMFELTERSLLNHPHALLAKVAALRRDGFMIALDDVGAHPDSLSMLDILMPDVIKLDLPLVQSQPRRDQIRTIAAVLAHHERTGATILAEGIENDDHLEQALALGATLGQGYKYWPAGSGDVVHRWAQPEKAPPPQPLLKSPFDLLASDAPLRTARKEILTALSRHIEDQAIHTADPPIVLSTLQDARYLTAGTTRRYLRLAQRSPLVAIFGQELPPDLGSGIRGVALSDSDPLCSEWTVVSLGAQTAVALIAREAPHLRGGPDRDRRFEFTITYNRSLVTAVARTLLDRML